MHEITYSQVGDYLIPNLTIGDEIQQAVYGKYGMLRKQYLKEHRKGTYAALLLSAKLGIHLAEVDALARKTVSQLVQEMAQQQGVDEALKALDSMRWVGAMNMIKVQAEEITMAKYVYC
ncbi:MAG: TnpV protein [Bacillota bacterium]